MIKNPKILIIDDIKDNISITKALIKKNFPQAIILTAVTGDAGIELATSTIPDVILLDILMPNKDGFTVCSEMKEKPLINDIPVVFITALKEAKEIKVKALHAGADGFITKPLDEVTLTAMITAMLKVRQAEIIRKNEKERLRLLVKEKTHSLTKELHEKTIIEEKLRNSQERYQGLIDSVDSGVVIHGPNTEITLCNPRASEMLGLTEDKLSGKLASDIYWKFTNENNETLPLEDYPVNKIIQTLSPLKNYVMGILRPDIQDKIWVSVNGYPRFNKNESLKEIVISFTDITDIKNHEENLIFLANNDYLTRLHNRRYFDQKLRKLNELDDVPISIVIADINGLKLTNDAFGHAYGDKLLIAAANVIQTAVDSTDIVCRIGGDEFAVIMPNTDSISAERKVSSIHQLASEVYIQSIQLSISLGHHTKTAKGVDLFTVSRTAEDIMYRQKIASIPSMRSHAIETILSTLHEKDKYSETHSRSVSEISGNLAKAYGASNQMVNEIKTAGLLHDIGKIIIPSEIITKNGSLDSDEMDIIQTHSEIGYRILNSSTQLRTIAEIVLNHHEKWDGTGYPQGVQGEHIPLESRIISIADAFDAMTSERSYRPAFTIEKATQEIISNAGTQFDPFLVDIFVSNLDEIISVKPD